MKNNHKFFSDINKLSGGAINNDDIARAKSGDVSALLDRLPETEAKRVKEILSSKEKRDEFLKSDAAKKLMNMLGGKGNG